jgi:hypothetical protein
MENCCQKAARRLTELLAGGQVSENDILLILRLQETGKRLHAFVSAEVHADILAYNRDNNILSLEDKS